MAVPSEPEALRQAIVGALGLSGDGCVDAGAAEGYRYAVRMAWVRMERVVGRMGASAIIEHAGKAAARRRPRVALVTVGEEGPDLSPLEDVDPTSACESLEELCVATFRTLVELTGDVVSSQVLDDLRAWRSGGPRTEG